MRAVATHAHTERETRQPHLNHDTTDKVRDDEQRPKRKRKEQVKLQCIICMEEHFTNQCPLLRGPKPTVAYCRAAEDGSGFFQIQAARHNQIVKLVHSCGSNYCRGG
jgi:hypothetical protein